MAADASAYGIGAAILHVFEDGSERSVAFTSHTLSPTEQNYPQIEKEALSLIYGIQQFHQSLYTCPFVLVTGHHEGNSTISCCQTAAMGSPAISLQLFY